jgi:hypothetical protein
MKNQLIDLAVPWMISPSISGFHITTEENRDTIVKANLIHLMPNVGIERAFIEQRSSLIFERGQWVRLHPGNTFEDAQFEASQIKDALKSKNFNLARMSASEWQEKWIADGICP